MSESSLESSRRRPRHSSEKGERPMLDKTGPLETGERGVHNSAPPDSESDPVQSSGSRCEPISKRKKICGEARETPNELAKAESIGSDPLVQEEVSMTEDFPRARGEIDFVDLADSEDEKPQVPLAKPVNIRSLLTEKEVDSWFGDDIIFTLLSLRTAGTNCTVVDSTWFLDNSSERRNGQMRRHLKMIEPSQEQKIVLPFCWEWHWMLLVINNINICCYDPKLPGRTFEDIPKIHQLSKDFNLPLVSLEHVGPKQAEEDMVNCGVYVVLTVETLCNERQWSQQDVDEFRVDVLEELDNNPNYCWTHLDVYSNPLPLPNDIKAYYTGRQLRNVPMEREEQAETIVPDCSRNPQESVICELQELAEESVSNSETARHSLEEMLFIAFFWNNVDLLKSWGKSRQVRQSDLQAATKKLMIILGVKTLKNLQDVTESSVKLLENRLKDFMSTLPENLLESRYAEIMAGYQALQKYVTDNGLSSNAQLTRAELLDIIITEVKKIKPAVCVPASSPAPIVAPEPIFPISSLQHLLPFYDLLNVPFPSQ